MKTSDFDFDFGKVPNLDQLEQLLIQARALQSRTVRDIVKEESRRLLHGRFRAVVARQGQRAILLTTLIERWRKDRRDRAALASMNEFQLRDIGIWRMADCPSTLSAPTTIVGRIARRSIGPALLLIFVLLGVVAIRVIPTL